MSSEEENVDSKEYSGEPGRDSDHVESVDDTKSEAKTKKSMMHFNRPTTHTINMDTLMKIVPSASVLESGEAGFVVHDTVLHRQINSATNDTDNSVTMVVSLHIRGQCWEEFRSAYLQFNLEFEKLRGHVSVTFFCPDGTPLDRQLSPGSIAIEAETSFEAVHKFESLALMKEALGSKIRNDWDARMSQWTTKAPEFFSYSGLTGFFALNRSFSPKPGPAPQPPPKWKVGFVILMTACVWACILDFSEAIIKLQMSIFPMEGPPSDTQRARWEFAVTTINLVPVFFLWAPLAMELFFIRAWYAVPWTKPGPQDTQGLAVRLFWNPIRWAFF